MVSFDLEPQKDEKKAIEANEATKKPIERTWRNWMLGPTVFLLMCGTGFHITTGHQYIYRRTQEDIFKNQTFTEGISYCDKGATNSNDSNTHSLVSAQQKAAEYELIFSVLGGTPAVVASVVLGSYTDKYGRKFLLILSVCGRLANTMVFVIGSYLHMDLILFGIAYVMNGVVGETFTFLLASFAYVADITSRKNRAMGIFLVEICLGLGVTVASLVCGYVIQGFGFKVSFIIAACLIIASLLLIIFIVPESYSKEKRESANSKCGYFLSSFEFYYASWNRGYRWKYMIVISVVILTMLTYLGRGSIEALYQLNAPFCWTPSKIGIYGAFKVGLMQLSGVTVLKIMKRFMDDDVIIAIIGSASFAAGYLMEGSATNDIMLYSVTVLGSCGMLTMAMMRSLASRMASPERQGAAAATISVAETSCHLFSGILMNAVYGATVGTVRGAAFYLMAGLCTVNILLLTILKIGSRKEQNKVSKGEKEIPIEVVSFTQKTRF